MLRCRVFFSRFDGWHFFHFQEEEEKRNEKKEKKEREKKSLPVYWISREKVK